MKKTIKKSEKVVPNTLALVINQLLNQNSRVGKVISLTNAIHSKAPVVADLYAERYVKD